MPTNSSSQEIRTRIDSFLAALSGLVRKSALESIHEALDGGPAPRRRRGPGRPQGSGRRSPGRRRKSARPARRTVARAGRRVRRSAADLGKIAARVLAQVSSKPGQRLEEIGKALKTDTGVLKRPVAILLASKKLKTKGQKRWTMYFAGGSRGRANKSRRKAESQRSPRTRNTRKAKISRRGSRRKAARRPAPRFVRAAQARPTNARRDPLRETQPARARAIAEALALQAARPAGPQ